MADKLNLAFSGASGMVGLSLAQSLCAHSATINAIPLSTSHKPNARQCPDLLNCTAQDWQQALNGADVYIHLASLLPFGNQQRVYTAQEFHTANCLGAIHALNGFALSGGQKMIFVSTLGINGLVSGRIPFSRDDTPKPSGDYAQSKLNAEIALAKRANEVGVELMIIRPPIIYGAHVGGKFRQLVEHIKAQNILPFGGIENMREMIGVRNFCDALIALALQTNKMEHPILMSDRVAISTPQLVTKIASAYGVNSRLVSVPKPVIKFAKILPVIGPAVQRLIGDLRIDDSYLNENCKWRPRFSIDDELAHMAQADQMRENP